MLTSRLILFATAGSASVVPSRWRFVLARILFLTITLGDGWTSSASALDIVKVQTEQGLGQLEGRIVVTAQDGGLLVETTDGVLHPVLPTQLAGKEQDDRPFKPMNREQLGEALCQKLPVGFGTVTTANYVIAYNTSREYAQWCGGLLERLHRAFENFWKQRGFKVQPGEFPLPVIVFSSQADYAKFAAPELGKQASGIIGYYSMQTNRIVMYDLTGMQGLGNGKPRRGTSAEITQMLAQPEAENAVATVIHEATHQLAFNGGLQRRFSDCPLWLSEGLAMYFEAPDLESTKGWRGIGTVNHARLEGFRGFQSKRPDDSLRTLIRSDERLRKPQSALDAYAESWALNHYLLSRYPKQYVQYLKLLSAKPPMVWDQPEKRLEDFQKVFGVDLPRLDAELLRYVERM